MFGYHHHHRHLWVASTGVDDISKPLGFFLEDRHETRGLGVHHRLETVGLALLEAACFFGFRLGNRFDTGFFNLGGNDHVGVLGGLFFLGTRAFGFFLGSIGLFESLRGLDLFSGRSDSFGFGFLLSPVSIGVGHSDLGPVLSLYGCSHGAGNLDPLFTFSLGLTDLAIPFLLGNLHLRLVDGACGRFFTERVDIAGFIGNVLDIDVDQPDTDLAQLDLNPVGDVLDQLVTVGVDLFDRHGGDHNTHLAEDNVLGQLLNVIEREPQEALSSVLHYTAFRGDTHGKG